MTKTEQNRVLAWRLKVLQEGSSEPRKFSQTCRHFGLSRKAFYKWKARYETHGEHGFAGTPALTPRDFVEVGCVVSFGQLFVRRPEGPIDHPAALHRGSLSDQLYPAIDVLVFVDG